MMKKLLGIMLLVLFLSSCIVRTRGPRQSHRRSHSTASCPPAYHWNGARCVHNGKARGHHKHKRHKHRR